MLNENQANSEGQSVPVGPITRKPRKRWINLEWEGWGESSDQQGIESDEQADVALPMPPIFSRSPRKHLVLPTQEVKLLEPPQMPTRPTLSLVQVFMPLVGIWIGIAISIFAARSANPNAGIPVTAFISAPMILLSAGAGIFNFFTNKKKYETDLKNRQIIYSKYIAEQKKQFELWKKDQIDSLLADNPDIDSCMRLVDDCRDRKYEAAQRLWERSPEDADFTHLRMGTGRLRTSFKVIPPEEPRLVLERDPLIDDGVKLAASYQFVDNLPVLLPLVDVGAAGIFGKEGTADVVRATLIQLAVHHAPTEVKIIFVSAETDEHSWSWVRWLPHNWSDDRKSRYFLSDPASRHIVLSEIEAVLQQRKNQRQDKQDTQVTPQTLPVYVFVFTDTALWTGSDAGPYGPFLDLLLREGRNLGAYSIFVGERRVQIPKTCGAVVEIKKKANESSGKYCGSLEMVGRNEAEVAFDADSVDLKFAVPLARSIASIELESIFEAENLPRRATIVDLFGVKQVKNIPLKDLWEKSRPYMSLHAPIGLRSGNKIAKVDFQEAGRGDGFGSHGMIGGTTGTGKTQFLQTLILLMCAHYKPEYLNFILIDYKGGDLALGLESLPHLVGTLANVEKEGNQVELIQRLFRSIEVEISRRKRILAGRNINDYIHEHMKHPQEMEPLSHLFIIIDEFAEMILKNPADDPNKNLMKRLLSIGAIGRSIGVHLILATQNPGTVVGDDLRNNINTRICLRMGTRDASMQILRRADAYEKIKKDEVGRAFIQVGNNDIFELLQAAWGGAPDGDDSQGDIPEVNLVDNIGVRSPALEKRKPDRKIDKQLDLLAERICHLALEVKSPRQQQVWLPVLPREIDLNELQPYKLWDVGGAASNSLVIEPIVGLLDDPGNRRQEALRVNLTKDGHFLIIGAPGTGKTTLLQTLLSSLVFEHTPDTLSLYLLDWGGRNLTMFENLPHVGAIVLPGEGERVKRLMTYLLALFEERRKLFETVDAKTIRDYRLIAKDTIQDIVVVIDNLSAYVDSYKMQVSITSPIELDALSQIAGEGGALGIHLVMASGSVNIPPRIRERISVVAALELNDNADYIQAVGRTGGLYPTRDIPGRGIIKQNAVLEFQTALPSKAETNPQRVAILKDEFKRINEIWGTRARAFQIPPLDKALQFENLDQHIPEVQRTGLTGLPICVGKALNSPALSPFWLDLIWGPHFWVSGSAGGGKTTLLMNLVLGLAEIYSPLDIKFCVIDPIEAGLGRLGRLDHTIYCASDSIEFRLTSIEKAIREGHSSSSGWARTIIVMDDIGVLKTGWVEKDQPGGNQAFLQTILGMKQSDCHIIAAGTSNDFTTSVSFPFAELIKKNRTGFLLATTDGAFPPVFNVKYGSESGRPMQTGWSFFFRRGNILPVQLATGSSEDLAIDQKIDLINNKWNTLLKGGEKAFKS